MADKNKRGRPKKEIDLATVEKLAAMQCTQEEIAQFFDVSVRTLQRNPDFCHAFKKGIDTGKMSLRRLQWKAAEKGNTTALIWLGKQYLGQTENPQELALRKSELEHRRYIDNERLEIDRRRATGDLDETTVHGLEQLADAINKSASAIKGDE